jgi:hypothetical protein
MFAIVMSMLGKLPDCFPSPPSILYLSCASRVSTLLNVNWLIGRFELLSYARAALGGGTSSHRSSLDPSRVAATRGSARCWRPSVAAAACSTGRLCPSDARGPSRERNAAAVNASREDAGREVDSRKGASRIRITAAVDTSASASR